MFRLNFSGALSTSRVAVREFHRASSGSFPPSPSLWLADKGAAAVKKFICSLYLYCSLAPLLLLLLLLSRSRWLLILPSHNSTFIVFVCARSTLHFIPCVCPFSFPIIPWFRSFVLLNTAVWNNIHACFNICTGDRTSDWKKFKYATTAVADQDIIDVRPYACFFSFCPCQHIV